MKPAPGMPGEFELIARHFAPLAGDEAGAYGLRDDAAVVSPAEGCELVAKTDAIVAGVHFPADDPAGLIAKKALRVNLSDLAAKGARARWYLVDLILPKGVDEAWVAAFAEGLRQDQETYGVRLIGGDTNGTPGPLTVAVTALGEIPAGRILRRGGARPSDAIFVTGTVGDAALGLAALEGRLARLGAGGADALAARYRLPEPRVAVGPRLIGLATASIDISDGLVADLGHICEVSGLDATVEAARVPLSPAARRAVGRDPAWLAAALTGGDDYEILFTAPSEAAGQVAALAREAGVPVTEIGRMAPTPADGAGRVTVLNAAGAAMHFPRAGWTHL